MPVTPEEAGNLGFRYAGEILRNHDDGGISFNLQENYIGQGTLASAHGWVYLWIKVNTGGRFDICYVGKAGRTLMDRCKQHEGGFRGGSTRGVALANLISEYLKSNVHMGIHVYARKSLNQTILDEKDVSTCEIEERAMIQKLRRLGAILWNIN
jgi:hypothetical protein